MTQKTKEKTISAQSSLSISLLRLNSQREESATCWTKAMSKTWSGPLQQPAEYSGLPGKEGCWKHGCAGLLSATGQWRAAQGRYRGPLEDTLDPDETLLSSGS